MTGCHAVAERYLALCHGTAQQGRPAGRLRRPVRARQLARNTPSDFRQHLVPGRATMNGMTSTYQPRPISPTALKELRVRDDAGHPMYPYVDEEGGAPLRCCLRLSVVDDPDTAQVHVRAVEYGCYHFRVHRP